MEEDKEKQEKQQAQEQQAEDTLKETIQKIKATAKEEDAKPSSQVSLRTILGGDLLTTEVVRAQI